MIRILDIVLSFLGICFFSPIIFFCIVVGFFDTGSPFFIQKRVGKSMRVFNLIKFRSMDIDAKSVATHLVDVQSITKWGSFLRKTKIDEIPQLFNVFIGDMSLVGPRPNLVSQLELIKERSLLNVYSVRPGITGHAQVNKIDMSDPKKISLFDAEMIIHFNLFIYFKFIFLTLLGNGFGDRVKINR